MGPSRRNSRLLWRGHRTPASGDCSGSLLRAVDPDLLPASPSASHNVLGTERGQAQPKEFLSSLKALSPFCLNSPVSRARNLCYSRRQQTAEYSKPRILQKEHNVFIYLL